jgi:sarcosine oxidase subunit alpha
MVRLIVDGVETQVPAGITVAAALLNRGLATRRARTGAWRAPVCGMGSCFECRATVDGQPHTRTCLVRVRDGLEVRTHD